MSVSYIYIYIYICTDTGLVQNFSKGKGLPSRGIRLWCTMGPSKVRGAEGTDNYPSIIEYIYIYIYIESTYIDWIIEG